MIKQTMRTFGLLAMCLSLSLGYTSCSEDEVPKPPQPTDSTGTAHQHEGEEKIAAVTLKLAAGHFHGVKFHQDNQIEGLKYLNAIQEIRLNKENGKWVVAEGSPKAFYVKASGEDALGAYGLWITYLAEDGDTLNAEFVTNGASAQHQHFFSVSDAKPHGANSQAEANDNDTQSMISYTYMDTNPWDKTLNTGAELVGNTDPVGLKGYFYFYKARKQFTLNIQLRHARTNKVINGVISPFYAPSNALKANSTIEESFPVTIFTMSSLAEEADWMADSDTPISDLSDKERAIIQAIADAYGISFEEAFKAFVYRIDNPGEHNLNSGLYF